ncbi:hypothetical protein CPB84DRAFT_1772105, partial [Gymnopilus junonius]
MHPQILSSLLTSESPMNGSFPQAPAHSKPFKSASHGLGPWLASLQGIYALPAASRHTFPVTSGVLLGG